ncbi:MAG TPA: hypothetical protein DIT04_12665, partial [Dysgonomonas sp.]|nr:hypothetical protein [Dysgonomonas sp.]
MATYKNSFYSNINQCTGEYIFCENKPTLYKGCKIYHRIKSKSASANCFDVVKDGVCIAMYCGLSGA